MSDFGLFEAATDAEQQPERQRRVAARKMSAAIDEVQRHFGPFMAASSGSDEFEDRWQLSRRDISAMVVRAGVGAYPSVMREVHKNLKSAWHLKRAEDRDAPVQNLAEGREIAPGRDLIPSAYNDPANGETAGVQRDFTDGGDSGVDSHHHEARQLVADLYTDWAQGNNLRVASMDTLDVYAANGLHDDDYYLLAGLIRRSCDCNDSKGKKSDSDSHDDKDTDGPAGPDTDSDGPPPSAKHESDSDDSDSDDSDDSESNSDSDSDGDSDSGGDDSDSGSDSGDNPFASDDDDADAPDDAADGGAPDDFGGAPDAGPADAAGPPSDVPPGDDGGAPDDGSGPPEAGPSDVGGQDFTVPDSAPDLPQDEMSQLQDSGPQAVPPEVIDDILGLPPGTLEQLIAEELGQSGGGTPPSGPPSGPPPQLASLQRRISYLENLLGFRMAAEDPTGAAESAGQGGAAAAPAQMPAAPPAGAGSAGAMPPPGSASVTPPPAPMPLENQPAEDALLDTATQAVTQMIDRETQEYQQIIDPLTQALQAIEFAQQVETAENPLDVTPPEGTVDVDPSAAPGGADSLEQKSARLVRRAGQITKQFGLTTRAHAMLIDAMSRKHYEHVAEAIRMVPPELRGPVAEHIGTMFHDDNPRFNHDLWMRHVAGSRRPFVGKTAGETWKNTSTMDSFEFPGQGEKPEISDNMKINDLPKMKGASLDIEAKGVLDMFDDFTKKRTDQGLNNGPEGNVDAFTQEKGDAVGPRALDKLKKTITTNQKAASFFTRRVPGWTWDDHLAGYTSKEARNFTCSCGNQIETPSYTSCHCGKIWNSYAIGDGKHLASDSADMFVTREVPVRKDVIMANRKMSGTGPPGDPNAPGAHKGTDFEMRDYPNWNEPMTGMDYVKRGLGDALLGYPPDMAVGDYMRQRRRVKRMEDMNSFLPQASVDDTEWVEDEDREHADAPHAPGKIAMPASDWTPNGMGGYDHPGGFQIRPEQGGHQLYAPAATMGSDPVVSPVKPPAADPQSHFDFVDRVTGQGPAGPSLKDMVRQHVQNWMANRPAHGGFAGGRSAKNESVTDESDGWVKYDDDDSARADGPKKPPSTKIKGGDPHWHSRNETGKFKSTNPFGG